MNVQPPKKRNHLKLKKHRGRATLLVCQRLFFFCGALQILQNSPFRFWGKRFPNLRRPSSKIRTLIIRFFWRTSIPAASWIWGLGWLIGCTKVVRWKSQLGWVYSLFGNSRHPNKKHENHDSPRHNNNNSHLGGGFKDFLFSPLLGEDSYFD